MNHQRPPGALVSRDFIIDCYSFLDLYLLTHFAWGIWAAYSPYCRRRIQFPGAV